MDAATETVTAEPQGLTREQIRRETAGHLAGELLERALQGTFFDVHMTLMQIVDAELIEPGNILAESAEHLVKRGYELDECLRKQFPQCLHGGAWHLHKRVTTLQDEVDLFRQEQFWLKKGAADLLAAERLIKDVFRYFRDAEDLLIQHDAEGKMTIWRRKRVPEYTANPYENLLQEAV